MTKEELLAAQHSLGFNNTEMAIALNVPYRTYYKWVTGEREMPSIAYSAVKMLQVIHANGLMHEITLNTAP
ncbi:hypothetical protein [Pectobacterium parmentieri]|uniref:hypothetical protein n=1 Tax=Pectobacterium parmentieri TaxID=1905730 RepID=UPI000F8C8418|nr:hypothetical protein [Pectobacterium parmentieri]AZS56780.1 hypothetical protein C5E18_11920 [Pectobacterium parmentieri]MBI0431683.1 hypothetical protein [Pectobacterium parmentieri]